MTVQNVIESGRKARAPVDAKALFARALLEALSTQCKAYCILSGYERLPDGLDGDIDFMVHQEDFVRMPRILDGVARQTGCRLFQAIDHELTGRAYFLAWIDGPSLTILQPDCASDYRHFGRLWLPATEVLAARRLHPNGFYVLSTAHEFAYSLIKRLNLGNFTRDDGYRLHRLYVEERIECGRMIARFCPGPEGSSIVRMASANDWKAMYSSPDSYRSAMLRSQKDAFWQRLQAIPERSVHWLQHILRPAGCSVAVTGRDSYEKSLVLSAVSREFAPCFRAVKYRQVLPAPKTTAHRPFMDPRFDLPRGSLRSTTLLIRLWFGYVFRYLTQVVPGIMSTQMVLLDHCLHDLVADCQSIHYSGPLWLLRAVARFSPKPNLVIVLDSPPERLRMRPPGTPIPEPGRRRFTSQERACSLPSATVIDREQRTDDKVRAALEAITRHLVQRVRRRLGLRLDPET